MAEAKQAARATLVQLSSGQVALQAGYFGFIASMPLALARSGVSDSQIGLLVGIVALVQIPAALIGGALVDRFGPVRMLGAGAAAYLFSVMVLLLPDVDAATSLGPFVVARVTQGIGFGLTRPAWLALLPRIIASRRSGMGLGVALAVQNLSMIVMPPLSLAVLDSRASLDGVALVVGGLVLLGILTLAANRGQIDSHRDDWLRRPAGRRYGFAYHWSWTPALAIMLFYLVHWGSLSAYLPQHAELAGANVGLFFATDGLFSLVFRVPSGWLADRVQARWLVLAGLLLTAIAIGLLTIPITTATLALAGVLTGTGAGLLTTPVYVELAQLSARAERGSAFAMVSVAAAVAILLGSAGVAPVIDVAGFEAAILVSMVGFAAATVVTLADRRLATIGHPPPEAPSTSPL